MPDPIEKHIVCLACGVVLEDRVLHFGNESLVRSNEASEPVRLTRLGPVETTTTSVADNMTKDRAKNIRSRKKVDDLRRKLNDNCDALDLPKELKRLIINIMEDYYTPFVHKFCARKDAFMASCIYIGCRIRDYEKTSDEISELCRADKRQMRKTVKDLREIMQEARKDDLHFDIPPVYFELFQWLHPVVLDKMRKMVWQIKSTSTYKSDQRNPISIFLVILYWGEIAQRKRHLSIRRFSVCTNSCGRTFTRIHKELRKHMEEIVKICFGSDAYEFVASVCK